MDKGGGHAALSHERNISGTSTADTRPDKDNSENYNLHEHPERGCAYVVTSASRAGAPRFCSRAAMPGSPYCAGHRALCCVAPGSARAARLVACEDAVAAAPPPELAHLAACAVLEPGDPAEDADDVAALARSRADGDEA